MKPLLHILFLMLLAACSQKDLVMSEQTRQAEIADKSQPLTISSKQGNSTITWTPDNSTDEYVIDISGKQAAALSGPQQKGKATFNQSNEAIRCYNRAQIQLYRKDYDSAMYFVNKSLELVEGSEALALKGSILYLKGFTLDARNYWQRAYELDSTIVIPENSNIENK